ncbi:MAG: response regulator transcription factor [Bacteroidetes bacterium]|nr:MAG: response regulator transcription factor [Bacteroidota bacterium]
MKAVIVEDEKKLRIAFKGMLELYCPEVEILGEADRVQLALPLIKEEKPDILFLDIELPDGSGFELMERLIDDAIGNPLLNKMSVIFITAHEEYAVKAFKLSAVDYLLKPVDPDELISAVEKARQKLDETTRNIRMNSLLENVRQANESPKKIALHTASGFVIHKINEIRRCEGEGNYTKFHLLDNKILISSKTLKEYDQMLAPYDFIRVHKSHLVNLNYVRKYSHEGYLTLDNEEKIPVSSRKKEQLYEIIRSL